MRKKVKYSRMGLDSYGRTMVSSEFDPTSLPNLLAQWTFDAGSGNLVPNSRAVGRSGPYVNLLQAPEYPTLLFGASGVTNNYAEAPDGNTTAARVQVPINDAKQCTFSGLSSAQRTFSIYVKTNVPGVDQNFKLYDSVSAANYTANDTWTRIQITSTGAHSLVWIWTDLGMAIDIQIWAPQFEAGAAPTAYQRPQFDLPLTAATATWAEGGVTSGGFATRTAGASGADLTSWTLYLLVRQTATGDYEYLLYDPNNAWVAHLTQSDSDFGIAPGHQNFLARTADSLWHAFALETNGTRSHMYLDGVCQSSEPASMAALSLSRAIPWQIKVHTGHLSDGFLYSASHDRDTVKQVSDWLLAVMVGRGSSVATTMTGRVMWEGDSILAATPGISSRSLPDTSLGVYHRTTAVQGDLITTQMLNRSTVEFVESLEPGVRNVVVLFGGTNDISLGANAATVFAGEKAIVANYRAAAATLGVDLRVIIVTTLPRGAIFFNGVTEASFNTERNALNALRVGDPSYYDAIARVDLEPDMGADGDSDNTTFYSDKVHPTEPDGNAALYAIIGPIVTAQLA